MDESKIIVPCWISQTFIQDHPNWIFVYGQDLNGKGCLGQPWVAVGLPNTFAVPTCKKVCFSATDRSFSDGVFASLNKPAIDKAIAKIPRDGRPIVPFLKIGEGCSELKKRAPITFAYLKEQLKLITYPNIEILWHL